MQDFEQALFPGMDQSQYRVLWIEHQDKLNEETGERRLELNFLILMLKSLQDNVYSLIMIKLIVLVLICLRRLQTMNINCMMQMTPLSPSRYNGKNLPKTVNEIKETLDIEATSR